jgi:dolichol-phosphate mannosyltransferase
MSPPRLLIAIPTYNEAGNVEPMCLALLQLGLPADILFCDDNSPDGTGAILDRLSAAHPQVRVLHRAGKEGIGSAHQAMIAHAYDGGYDQLLTLDCDFSHSPADLPRLLEAARGAAVTVGSRWHGAESLPGWSLLRRMLTGLGHLMTKHFLQVPQDASGALRLYDLRQIPRELFARVRSRSYGFFFESLFVLVQNGFLIREVPIVLPARTYGHSKLTFAEAARSGRFLLQLAWERFRHAEQFRLPAGVRRVDPALHDPQDWDSYWSGKSDTSGWLYDLVAGIYRRGVIMPYLERFVRRNFPPGATLLHAGCGSGQVDVRLHGRVRITAVDISPAALRLYARHNPVAARIEQADIFRLPFADATFDGVYNLGVMEHFTTDEIARILSELRRVLRPGGKAMLLWPRTSAPSVWVLRMVHWFLAGVVGRAAPLHPPEISLLSGRADAEAHLQRGGFKLVNYHYGPGDLFIQAVLVAEPSEASRP